MAKKLSSVLGVDIGSRTTKIAEIKTQNRQPVITALGIIDTPEGAVDNTGVYNPEAVGLAIKQAIKAAGASVGQVVVTIAGQSSVLVRTLEVPRMSPTELKEHMQWEINRNIPFSESNVISDYKALPDEDPNSQNMDVVMAISPQSAIDTLIATFKKAGKQLVAIDVEPLSLARVYQFSYGDIYDDQIVCVVDVGHSTTSINIYKGGRLMMPRQVPLGAEMFTKAIADALAVGNEDAEALQREHVDLSVASPQASISPFGAVPAADGGLTQEFAPYNPFTEEPTAPASQAYNPFAEAPAPAEPFGASEPEPAEALPEPAESFEAGAEPQEFEISESPAPEPTLDDSLPVNAIVDPQTAQCNDALIPVVEEFVAEIRRSLDYFQGRGGSVSRVIMCGGGSMLKGFADYLRKSLGVDCDEFDPMRRLNLTGKRIDATLAEERKQEFAVAIGNGLYVFFD